MWLIFSIFDMNQTAMEDLYNEYLERLQSQEVFTYTGTLDGELIASLLQLSDSKLKEQQANIRKKKNVINILIECLQNIYYHMDTQYQNDRQLQQCLVKMGIRDGDCLIYTGNHIPNREVEQLRKRLEVMKPMNAEELHAHYLDKLDGGQLSEKGGAGLGMIRIFREAGQQVSYHFRTVSEDFSFFTLAVRVSNINHKSN